MRMLALVWIASVAVLVGCPSGNDDGTGTGTGNTGAGLDDGAWDPESCSQMAQMQNQTLPGNCTQADFDQWNDCLIDACEGQFEACYGPGFRTGTYSGACAPFAECASDCQCSDGNCASACPGAQACADCLQTNLCGGQCQLSCALAGTGIDTSKTCDDLLSCCATLDTGNRMQCTEGANMLKDIPNGDASCAGLYRIYSSSGLCP